MTDAYCLVKLIAKDCFREVEELMSSFETYLIFNSKLNYYF